MDLLLLVSFARCTLPRFAVIVPHVPGDAERIVASITTTWSDHAPCAAASSDAVLPSLILYAAHATFDDAALQSIASLPHVARCFGAVEMLVHPLEPWQDVYLHAPPLMWLNLVLGDGICDGAPHGGTRDRFDYFVLMEPDVLPVRALWLDEVARNVNANEVERPGARWWSFGGVGVHTLGDDAGGADGRSPRVRLHLNGNGVYRLHDAGFEAYVKDVVAAYSLGVPGQRICCYDAALFEHALADFERAHLVLHRFRWSEMILNNQAEWVREEARVRAFAEWRFPAHVFFVHRGTVKGVEEGAVAFSDEAVARIKPLARDALEVPQQPRKARRRGDRITSEAVALAVRRALADASARCRSGSRIATPRLLRPAAGAALTAGEDVTLRVSIRRDMVEQRTPYELAIDDVVVAQAPLSSLRWVAAEDEGGAVADEGDRRAIAEVVIPWAHFSSGGSGDGSAMHLISFGLNHACVASVPVVIFHHDAPTGSFAHAHLWNIVRARPEMRLDAYLFADVATKVLIHPVAAMLGGGFGMLRMEENGAPVSFDTVLVRLAHDRIRALRHGFVAVEATEASCVVYMLDLGANTGCFSLIAAHAPWLRVVAFEPVRITAEVLRANLALNGLSDRVAVSSIALSDGAVRRGTIALPTLISSGGLSTIAENPTRFMDAQSTRLPIVLAPLDVVWPLYRGHLPRVDFLKVRLGGWEGGASV